ncbi:MAG: helix-turn-helix domain-containing protein, partial [Planctomycetota bacterium]
MPPLPTQRSRNQAGTYRHIIKETEQRTALRTPLRFQIISTIEQLEACSVNEIAPHVGMAPESLYYHIKKLVKAGLVRVKTR